MRDWFIKVKNALRQVAAFIYRAMVQTKVFITLRNFVFKHRYDSIHRHYPQILEEARKKISSKIRKNKISMISNLMKNMEQSNPTNQNKKET